jgi:hypothetical protein
MCDCLCIHPCLLACYSKTALRHVAVDLTGPRLTLLNNFYLNFTQHYLTLYKRQNIFVFRGTGVNV